MFTKALYAHWAISNPRILSTMLCLLIQISALAQIGPRQTSSHPTTIKLEKLFDSARDELQVKIRWDEGVDVDLNLIVTVSPCIPLDSTLISTLRSLRYIFTWQEDDLSIKGKAPAAIANRKKATGDTISYRIRVKGPDDDILPNTNIKLKSTGKSFRTDMSGTVVIATVKRTDSITLSYINMKTEKLALSKQTSLDIQLQYAPDPMNEVMVTDYWSTTKSTTTGDIFELRNDQSISTGQGSPQTMMEGTVPGMLVTQASGIACASVTTLLRGQSSILNSKDPYYIVDNVPYASGNISISNITSSCAANSYNPLYLLSPDEIETITILKDADATAIYGSRGANGVIQITTRKGKPGKSQLSMQASTGSARVTCLPRLMNMQQYMTMRLEALKNDNMKPDTTNAPDLLLWNTHRSVNWGKWLVGGSAPTASIQASLSGGNDTLNYIVGVDDLWQTLVFPTQPSDWRTNGHANINYRLPGGKLEIKLNGLYSLDNNHQPITDPTGMQLLVPNAPNLTDKLGHLVFQANGVNFNNPMSYFFQPYQISASNRLADALITYRISSSLTAKINIGYDAVEAKEASDIPIVSQTPLPGVTGSSYSSFTKYTSAIIEPQLEYEKKIKEFDLSLLQGATWQAEGNNIRTLTGTGFTSDSQLKFTNLAPILSPDSQFSSYHYEAIFTRANVNWKNMYILNFTDRLDRSTELGPGGQFGNFWALGSAWIFADDNRSIDALPFLSFGKLRASYGITGNGQIGNHYFESWTPTAAIPFQNIQGSYTSSQAGSGITWENIKKMEFALEGGLLDNRILFTLAWYRHRSSNLLLPDSLPLRSSILIFSNQNAVLENRGWEFSLTSTNIKSKNFQWTMSFNASFPINMLVSFPGLGKSLFAQSLVIGKSLAVIQAYQYKNVDRTTGLFTFAMQPGEASPTDADNKVVGQFAVTCFGGLNNTLRWKNLQFDCLADARWQSGSNYQAAIYAANAPGSIQSGLYSNETTALLNRWQKQGDQAQYQKLTTLYSSDAGKAITYYTASSAIITNASFLRLRRVSLSYEFPRSLLKKMHLKGAKIFVDGQNLATLSPYKGVDPEQQSIQTLPLMRMVEAGIHLSI